MTTRLLEIREGVLSKNDLIAADLRRRFAEAKVRAFNLVSSPGTGKTELLAATLTALREGGHSVAAIVGDLATTNDADRLARSGAPVRQIETGDLCHLEAAMIGRHLDGWDLEALDLLFIENVGNLVCPAGYDLGETARVAMLSVTEGEDKPAKYPVIFNSADLVVITKVDIADAVEFDEAAARAAIDAVNPGVPVIGTSARTGTGMREWIDFLTTNGGDGL